MRSWTWLGLAALVALTGCGPADLPATADDQAVNAGAPLVEAEYPCTFLPAEDPAAVSLASEPNGPAIATVMRHEFVAEARSGDWVLVVAAEAGRQGWVAASQGVLQGNCALLEVVPTLPPLAANVPTIEPPTCLITLNAGAVSYVQPNFQEVFASLGAGTTIEGMAQSADGWYGFDPGIEQPDAQGVARLRWLPRTDAATQSVTDHCAALPIVQFP